MKLSFSTNAFKKYSLLDAVEQIAACGYDGLEILCDTPHLYPPDFTEQNYHDLKKTAENLSIAFGERKRVYVFC